MSSKAAPPNIFIYQIHYNDETRAMLDPGFIPLDNTANERPDWYEFWVIRNFLNSRQLEPETWYGFLSPKFRLKTGFTSAQVMALLQQYDRTADVALFSAAWDQIAYFTNPFEQGEVWHPQLLNLSQQFVDHAGLKVDLRQLVTYSLTSAFSNYIVAKPPFWKSWLELSGKLFDYVEQQQGTAVAGMTSYGAATHLAPMKTFIQERLATLVLARGNYQVVAPNQAVAAPIFRRLFRDDERTRKLLQACDLLKGKYCLSGDTQYLDSYRKVRAEIPYTPPTT